MLQYSLFAEQSSEVYFLRYAVEEEIFFNKT